MKNGLERYSSTSNLSSSFTLKEESKRNTCAMFIFYILWQLSKKNALKKSNFFRFLISGERPGTQTDWSSFTCNITNLLTLIWFDTVLCWMFSTPLLIHPSISWLLSKKTHLTKNIWKKSSSSTIQPMRWIDYPFIWFAVFVLWIIWCLMCVERSKRAEVQREIVIVENKRLVHLLDLTTDFRVKTNAKLTPISKLREKSKICIQSCLYTQ